MNWKPNTGTRPKELKDSDKVHVRLRNGMERGSWQVQTSQQHKIRWSQSGHDFDVMEWAKA